jgi:uncharacterized protein (TIGR02246 family)
VYEGLKMKKILLLSMILICCGMTHTQEKAPNAPAGAVLRNSCTDPDANRAARQIADQWKNGYNNGDAAKVASLYTEDAYYLTQHFVTGIVQGRANIRAYVQRGVDARYHIDSIQIISTDCSGDLAYTVDRYETTNAGQKAFGVNLVVVKRIGNNWRIVAHESAVPDPATAIQRLDAPSSH